jgi:hypothetical protein
VAQKGAVLAMTMIMMMIRDQNRYITEVHEIQPASFNRQSHLGAIRHYDFFFPETLILRHTDTCA